MTTPKFKTAKHQAAGWFGTVDDFVDPLIEYLQPGEDKTVRQQYRNTRNGRVLGWLDMTYGHENIQKFIDVCDEYGFDNIITDIYVKHIKTLGRFKDYLDNK